MSELRRSGSRTAASSRWSGGRTRRTGRGPRSPRTTGQWGSASILTSEEAVALALQLPRLAGGQEPYGGGRPCHGPGKFGLRRRSARTGCGSAVNLRDPGTGAYGAVAGTMSPPTPFGPGTCVAADARATAGERCAGEDRSTDLGRRDGTSISRCRPYHHPLAALHEVGFGRGGRTSRPMGDTATAHRQLGQGWVSRIVRFRVTRMLPSPRRHQRDALAAAPEDLPRDWCSGPWKVLRPDPTNTDTGVARNDHTVRRLHAAVLHLLGLDSTNLTSRFGDGEPGLTSVAGRPIRHMLACGCVARVTNRYRAMDNLRR